MSYFLQNQHLIILAPLIAVPVLVHLLTRAKPPKYLFSATTFVMKVVQQTIRIKRPKDRLLLLCRTMLFLLLFLIFLRPVVFLKDRLASRDAPKNLVMVIDRSASMAWSEGGRTRLAAAVDEASAILARLSSRDKANIVWIDREPDAVFPEMGSNVEYLRERLKEVRCTNEYGNAQNAIKLALSQLESVAGVRELCIISDFQTAQWKNIDVTVPEEISVATLSSARETASNGAVLSISTNPVAPLVGDTAQVMLSIGNFSNIPRNRTVIVKIGEHIVTRQLQVPAWGRGAVVLEHVFHEPGLVTISARLDEDSFGADDRRMIQVPVRPTLQAGLAGDDSLTAPVFRRALRALPWIELVEIHDRNMEDQHNLDVMVLAGWKGQHQQALSRLMQNGTAFIIAPADGLPLSALDRLLGRQTSITDYAFQLQPLDKPMGLSLVDKNHKAFDLFRDGQFGDPSQAAFTQRLVSMGALDNGKMLLSFIDSRPALIEYTAPAPAVLWLAPLSSECGNWAHQSVFLPFFGELLGSLGSHRSVALPDTFLPGEPLSFDAVAFTDDRQLYDDAGQAFPVVRIDSAEKGIRFVSEPILSPGIYRMCARQDCTSAKIVNFPEVESDLRTGPPPHITQGSVNAVRSADELAADREGTSLWRIFIWAVLVLIGMECLLVLLLEQQENKMAQGTP